MTTWSEMANENALAANRLIREQTARSGILRAYFAAYCQVTARLHAQGVRQFGDRGNPSHTELPSLVRSTLTGLRPTQRQIVAGAVSRLYLRRIAADYQPRFSVGPITGHEALRDMNLVTQILGGNR